MGGWVVRGGEERQLSHIPVISCQISTRTTKRCLSPARGPQWGNRRAQRDYSSSRKNKTKILFLFFEITPSFKSQTKINLCIVSAISTTDFLFLTVSALINAQNLQNQFWQYYATARYVGRDIFYPSSKIL